MSHWAGQHFPVAPFHVETSVSVLFFNHLLRIDRLVLFWGVYLWVHWCQCVVCILYCEGRQSHTRSLDAKIIDSAELNSHYIKAVLALLAQNLITKALGSDSI